MDQRELIQKHKQYIGVRDDMPIFSTGDRFYLETILTVVEYDIVDCYWRWMEALAHGELEPYTDEQRRFVKVANGEEQPVNIYESVWIKVHQAFEKRDEECREDAERMKSKLQEEHGKKSREVKEVGCTCGGTNPRCTRCDGRGYYKRNELGEIV